MTDDEIQASAERAQPSATSMPAGVDSTPPRGGTSSAPKAEVPNEEQGEQDQSATADPDSAQQAEQPTE